MQITIFRQSAERVAALNPRLFNLRLGDFKYVDCAVHLGDLAGNRFLITLRGVEPRDDALVGAAAEGLRSSGFINYFGLQRFGVGPITTHAVGAALLKGQWQEAIDLLLMPRHGDILPPPTPHLLSTPTRVATLDSLRVHTSEKMRQRRGSSGRTARTPPQPSTRCRG